MMGRASTARARRPGAQASGQASGHASDQASAADVCFLLEGTYPYVMGGVSGWTHALIGAMPDTRFAIAAIQPDTGPHTLAYDLPGNVVTVADVALSHRHRGRSARRWDGGRIREVHRMAAAIMLEGDAAVFAEAREFLLDSGLGEVALLDSRLAWQAILDVGDTILPNASLLQFFWTWRTLMSGLLTCLTCPVPQAHVYHAISTGYAGLLGARVALETGRPLLITEHGIYTNERRIELSVADWLHDTGRAGLAVSHTLPELRDLWLRAFSGFARIAYDTASQVTTLYGGNQVFQAADGAPPDKLRIIPNGVDVDTFAALPREAARTRPTVALIGRVVPIKDIRMFISACDVLRQSVPDVEALILGPDAEDPDYARECRQLVDQLGLGDTIRFCGRVKITDYLPRIDLLALTSLSEAQPLVLLEAGAAAIPAVATDVGSCREILEGFAGDTVTGAGGRIVPCGDASAAGRAMAEILLDPQLRADMGAVMARRVAATYNKTVIDQRYRALYAEAMAPTAGVEG